MRRPIIDYKGAPRMRSRRNKLNAYMDTPRYGYKDYQSGRSAVLVAVIVLALLAYLSF